MSESDVLTLAGDLTREQFLEKNGLLMGTEQVAGLLGYPNKQAFRQAVYRGREPLGGYEYQKGRKIYYPTTTIFDRLIGIEKDWIQTASEQAGTPDFDQEALHRAIREETGIDDGELTNEDIRRLAKQL